MTPVSTPRPAKQLLHLVFGGELKTLTDVEFTDLDRLDVVGIYPSYAEAYKACRWAISRSTRRRRRSIALRWSGCARRLPADRC